MKRKEELGQSLLAARAKTLWLLDQVPEPFFKVRVHSFYSPIGWHFGHIGRTEEHWVLHKALGRPMHDDDLSFLFTDRPDNPKDNRVNLPSREQIGQYLDMTGSRVLDALDHADLDSSDQFLNGGYAWEFALQHECQHQETICEMLQLIQKQCARHEDALPASSWGPCTHSTMLRIQGGTFDLGSSWRHSYDNEKMPHEVMVPSFDLDRCPVTAGDWAQFIDEGGYRKRELWTDEGWAWRCSNDAVMPEYWIRLDGGFGYYSPVGIRPIDMHEPAGSISWFEANAFARWIGKRLPSEAEWEYAASSSPLSAMGRARGEKRWFPWGDEEPSPEKASFGINRWEPGPVGQRPGGASSFGVLDLAGGIWEWTSTPFLPYPGFEAFPYARYSKEHMDGGHFVCRGGSWATAGPILRCTFRNWYVPTYRQGFLGLRCAA